MNAIAPRTGTRRPKVGIYLPNWTGGTVAGKTPTWDELRALAQVIEDAGFDSLWVADEFRSVFPDGDAIGYWESTTMLGAAAAVTHRIELGPLVAAVGFRNPALIARMAAALDEISGGRAVLGLGAGYDETEHRSHGFAWDHRVSRLEEAASIIGQLLRTGWVDHHGRFFEMSDVVMEPRGPRPGGLPLIIGTVSIGPRLMRCVARFADGWNGWLAFDDNRPEAVRPHLAALDAACREIGRDPATLRRSVGIAVATTSNAPFRYGPIDLADIAVRGTTDEMATVLRGFADEGVDEVMIYAFPLTPTTIERLAPVLEQLDA
jgi:alkanesulfonate monooxygenase SsuD/methylene tetrahydromethanopterin reductase-like flavin-dependent oxidoreductase (luciferase family)